LCSAASVPGLGVIYCQLIHSVKTKKSKKQNKTKTNRQNNNKKTKHTNENTKKTRRDEQINKKQTNKQTKTPGSGSVEFQS
jgi:hypothetical protein